MTSKEKGRIVLKELKKKYGNTMPLYLNYHKNKQYEFLFAVMMSAQCTDLRVNAVTKELYKKYKSLDDFAKINSKILEKDIYSVGFYHNKAENIVKCARELLTKFNGKVPNCFDDLISLPGVGRKTANVVLTHLFNIPGMAVDTHVARISNILFKLNENKPDIIEKKLMEIIDKKDWGIWNTHIIALGREFCVARKPKCEVCIINKICNK